MSKSASLGSHNGEELEWQKLERELKKLDPVYKRDLHNLSKQVLRLSSSIKSISQAETFEVEDTATVLANSFISMVRWLNLPSTKMVKLGNYSKDVRREFSEDVNYLDEFMKLTVAMQALTDKVPHIFSAGKVKNFSKVFSKCEI